MGFHRTPQPVALDRTALTAVVTGLVAEELAFAIRTSDPFGIDHDCLNPAGHHFIADCGEIICPHCSKVAWQ